jgi:predicted acylesterase/phospholipase RssA
VSADRGPDPRGGEIDRVAVALSGGGHRATLFGLGALLYLVDSGLNRRVVSIASVSGGSIANGVVAQEVDFRATTPSEFRERVAGPLARRIVNDGVLFAYPPTWILIATSVALVVCAIGLGGFWSLPLDGWVRGAGVVVALAALAAILRRRGVLHDRALGRYLLRRGDRRTQLAETCKSLDHVFCATDLEGQHHVYFMERLVWSHDHGEGTPGSVDLATVVQASAAFPGAFPPRTLAKRTFGFRGAEAERERSGPKASSRLVLADGGVYDNMGDQWAAGYHRRARGREEIVPADRSPQCLVVVNASARPGWRPLRSGWIPFAGELAALLRVIDVLFNQTTTGRRQTLRDRFDDEGEEDALRGAFVSIDRSPSHLARMSLHRTDASRQRAEEVLRRLGSDGERLERESRENTAVVTSLGRLPADVASRLVWHGYVSTMCNAHVLFGWPLLDGLPDRAAPWGPLPVVGRGT